MSKITDDQVMALIVEHVNDNGYPPSIRTMALDFSVSPETVLRHLRSLEADGRIERVPGQPRAIKVTP